MLELKQIVKDYPVANTSVHALKGVDLQFRTAEFVSILGPSGCGKTTLLNIIGGLDKYTTGDLIIDGVSTKDYKDRDWDTYRNHTIGFVFQTYNLIPHQTVLKNVELALTLAGVPKGERRPRAEEALKKVGLGDHMNKRPNQLSGGQMQRVAIARALVNDPNIILADEPTGALDTETGIQIMELLKEMAKDRLVIMVTHNPDLAEQYSTRIIRILDGVIVGDSKPLAEQEYNEAKQAEKDARTRAEEETAAEKAKKGKAKKTKKRSSMSFWTAFKLSLNNLFTKKGRTILTSFAGSIGIIGIALILSVSQGMTHYIDYVEQQTLSSYPLTIESSTMDLTAIVANMMNTDENRTEHGNDKVYKRSMIYDLVNMVSGSAQKTNDLKAFKKFLEDEVADENSKLHEAVAGLSYNYNLNLSVYTENVDGDIMECNVGNLMRELLQIYLENVEASTGQYYAGLGSFNMNIWQEILSGTDGSAINDVVKEQYDVVYGEWPNEYDEVVLVMTSDNEISDIALYALGLIGQDYIDDVADAIREGKQLVDRGNYTDWDYSQICGTEAKVILNHAFFDKSADGTWRDLRDVEREQDRDSAIRLIYNSDNPDDVLKLRITGIVRPNPDATVHMLSGTIGYTVGLKDYVVAKSEQSDIVIQQKENPNTDVMTGLPFGSGTGTLSNAEKKTYFLEYFAGLPAQGSVGKSKQSVYLDILCLDNPQAIETMTQGIIAGSFGDPVDRERLVNTLVPILAEQMQMSEERARALINAFQTEQLLEMIYPTIEEQAKNIYKAQLASSLAGKTDEECQQIYDEHFRLAEEGQFAEYYDNLVDFSEASYKDNLESFGCVDLEQPIAVNIYASSFDNKDIITQEIDRYNDMMEDDDSKITYTDLVALVMNAVTQIMDAVTYVLIAFVAISLIVSSIMIGVITLISVQERTKEIGILRAIGASKRDVSGMFNAETIIIGFAAGLIGVLATYLLCIPVNIILRALTGMAELKAVLPLGAAAILVAISVLLTMISGLIPSRSAAKKDPVVALRTE